MARREDEYLKQRIQQGIGGWNGSEADRQQAELNQKDADEWNKNYSLMQEAAKMRPDVSLGFSLGRLLFNNADKWFGHKGRNQDGTKAGAENIGKVAMDTLDPAGQKEAIDAINGELNVPAGGETGISLQQNTFNPNTNETTSTTLSTNNPELLTGGQSPTFGVDMNDPLGVNQMGYQAPGLVGGNSNPQEGYFSSLGVGSTPQGTGHTTMPVMGGGTTGDAPVVTDMFTGDAVNPLEELEKYKGLLGVM